MQFAFLLLFIAAPLLELAVLIRVGQAIGVAATLAIVIGTAFLGLFVFRLQGFRVLNRARQALQEGTPPVIPVLDGSLLAMAGGLLILPGLIGDAIGLLLLIPPLRRLVAAWIVGRATVEGASRVKVFTVRRRTARTGDRGTDRATDKAGPVIEGEYTRIDDPGDKRDRS
jgi:UPF0716 protein FxsA